MRKKKLSDEISMKNLLVEEHNARMSKGQIVEAYDWDQIVSSLFSSQQLTWDQEIEELVKKHSTKGKVYLLNDEIIATLQQLRSKGYTLVAATNGFAKYQLPVMEFLGIASHFDVILTLIKRGTPSLIQECSRV
ncbi:hypothetical protein JCM19037_3391 [Geomicrobium sp. JCM 19037]|uniref:HAD hydrolase-like protein n=1 Tax=Geomicrobium sp. JCM 19037 TaxID=1460634 RepID=UPI00045F10D2|nr:HAD hydrolase-like protein [Geomicrobium sp. JCM 19037]GAK04933.1 hypothetical protein JCM19037_3391 [Geomicrobium sp. JCM 19037]